MINFMIYIVMKELASQKNSPISSSQENSTVG
jgi:hypothetical protein